MPKAADPASTPHDTDFQDIAGLAARVASLELDAETLEMVMAALTADVCDQIETGTT